MQLIDFYYRLCIIQIAAISYLLQSTSEGASAPTGKPGPHPAVASEILNQGGRRPPFRFLEEVMTQKPTSTSNGTSSIKVIVFGVDGDCKPHAAWFPKEHADTAPHRG